MAYKFQISAKLLSWPKYCACCSAVSDTKIKASASRTTGKRVKNTTTSWWEVPYCTTCINHKNAYEGASIWFAVSFALGIGAWYITPSGGNGLFYSFIIFVAGTIPFLISRNKAKTLMTPTCSCPSSAVSYLAWHGTFHTFVFTNKNYLESFLSTNSRKSRSDITEI
jgi:hypothetical protein